MVAPSLVLTAYNLVSHHSFLFSFSLGSGRVDHSIHKTSAFSDSVEVTGCRTYLVSKFLNTSDLHFA